ncbi:MAG: hypothetical protein IPN34_19355 [Planctomycetes bacterium]|nr:hypothetical protein [Planctomycetota bacterium]
MTPLTIATFCLSLLAASSLSQEPAPAAPAKPRIATRWSTDQGPHLFQWNGEVVEAQEPEATCPHCGKSLPKPKAAPGFVIQRSKPQDGASKPRVFRAEGTPKFHVVEGSKLDPSQRKVIALKSLEGLNELKELKGITLAKPEMLRGRVVEVAPDGAKPKRIERRMDEEGNVEVIEIGPGEHRVEVRKRAMSGQRMKAAPAQKSEKQEKRVRVHRVPGGEAGGTTVIIIGGGDHVAPRMQVREHHGNGGPHRIEISQLEAPEIEVEGFEMPEFEIPAFEIEGFEMPAIEIEGFEMPAIDLRGLEFPALRFGDFRFPGGQAGACEDPCTEESIEVRNTEIAPRPAAPASTRDLIHL